MKNRGKTLEDLVKKLTPADKDTVREFVESLLRRRDNGSRGKPKFPWAGALKELAGRFTSVELQHQISRWRISGE